MKNPCIKICEFDRDVCRGCGRTQQEIKGWKKLDRSEMRRVLAEADMRLLVLEASGRRVHKR